MNYIYTSYKIVDSIERNGAFSSIELNNALKLVDEEDKGKVTRIVYGVLDNSIKYDYIIKALCEKKPKGSIATLLKVGLYLIYEMDSVPNYASIDNCVKIAKKISKGALGGFVNGSLRKAVDFKLTLPSDKMQAMSIDFSMPLLICELLVKEYGEVVAKEILTKKESNSANIRINLKVNSIDEFKKILSDNAIEFAETARENCLQVNLKKLMSSEIDNFRYTVQALASVCCCDNLGIKDCWQILDVCGAPGGKSVYMAELSPNGKVISCDVHTHRLSLIKKYAQRMSVENVDVKELDGTQFEQSYFEKFDGVLVDAPCSGIGVHGSKPDIALSFTREKLDNLAVLQFEILNNSAKYLKKGGSLIYSTCTVFDEENDDVVGRFLQSNDNFEVQQVDNFAMVGVQKKYGFQLLPDDKGQVGFYLAKLRKL